MVCLKHIHVPVSFKKEQRYFLEWFQIYNLVYIWKLVNTSFIMYVLLSCQGQKHKHILW